MEKTVLCPHCKSPSVFSVKNPFRPFCSERCQMIDLGKWATEKYAVPTEDSVPVDVNKNPEDDDEPLL